MGAAGAAASVLLVGLLHVIVDPAQVNPVRRTISEYALGEYKLIFDAGVLALALGSVAVLVGLIRTRVLRAASAPAVLLAVWSVSLVVVVAFEKTNWSIGPSVGGYIHRYASLVAFLSLPIGALLVARQWRRHAGWGGHARWTHRLAAVSLVWLAPILAGFALRPLTGVPWWRAVPLGLLERGLAATEVALVVALGLWAAARARQQLIPATARPAVELRQA
ncbi:DUF998 domain-containing protein [Pseudonocardia bannensis]|uniref:DUF998 domain-containing protein n=1 Tax=Pseudonocardia bannensis TaxID=630973 RepID=A0A848DSY9_9PSEU|nr:DUF998 domain-containing protein [Pseudonocardia bannensis]NMH95599.1 DUF998 domain-containing protein [Pseudonocardia bannensis]